MYLIWSKTQLNYRLILCIVTYLTKTGYHSIEEGETYASEMRLYKIKV